MAVEENDNKANPNYHAWVNANWHSAFKRGLPSFCSGACPIPEYGVFIIPVDPK